jgi:thiol-disulfide isomerase/thioredoxin
MQSAFFSRVRRMRGFAASLLSLSLLLAAACGGAPAPVVVSNKVTPSGKTMPRTSLPMPPTATNGDRSAESFTLLDNSRVKLSDYEGQVVVLDFWATYCPPCRDEAPHLSALQQRFGDKGLRIIGLNVGGPDDRPKIPEFTQQFNLKYTFGFPDPQMVNLYMGSDDRIPQTVVFDRNGRIIKHFVGYDNTVSAELERTIEKAVTSDE